MTTLSYRPTDTSTAERRTSTKPNPTMLFPGLLKIELPEHPMGRAAKEGDATPPAHSISSMPCGAAMNLRDSSRSARGRRYRLRNWVVEPV
ncbi:hypothetical protein Afe04nite_27270 [Asanoa ferruginea]|nr:hypothetical protein Afe04nite_27270 [Asanoa ferruginea]